MLPHAKKIARILEFCGMVGYYRLFARSLRDMIDHRRTSLLSMFVHFDLNYFLLFRLLCGRCCITAGVVGNYKSKFKAQRLRCRDSIRDRLYKGNTDSTTVCACSSSLAAEVQLRSQVKVIVLFVTVSQQQLT